MNYLFDPFSLSDPLEKWHSFDRGVVRSVACNYKVSHFTQKQNGLFQKWHLEHFARNHAFSQDGDD